MQCLHQSAASSLRGYAARCTASTGSHRPKLLLAIMPFGEAWFFGEEDEPIHLYSRRTHRRIRPAIVDAETGEPIDPRELHAGPGPSFPGEEEIRRKRFTEYFGRRID